LTPTSDTPKARLRPSALFLATFLLVLTFICVRRAYAVTTVANKIDYSFQVASGAVSPGIVLPRTYYPILVQATTYLPTATRGVAGGTVAYNAANPGVMSWSTTNAAGCTNPVERGNSGVIGTDIMCVSAGTTTSANSIEIGPTVNQIRVDNDESATTATIISITY